MHCSQSSSVHPHSRHAGTESGVAFFRAFDFFAAVADSFAACFFVAPADFFFASSSPRRRLPSLR
jgi:hypothetical protein